MSYLKKTVKEADANNFVLSELTFAVLPPSLAVSVPESAALPVAGAPACAHWCASDEGRHSYVHNCHNAETTAEMCRNPLPL